MKPVEKDLFSYKFISYFILKYSDLKISLLCRKLLEQISLGIFIWKGKCNVGKWANRNNLA